MAASSLFAARSVARQFACRSGSVVAQQLRGIASGMAVVNDVVEQTLQDIRDAGTWKNERVITSKQADLITVAGSDEKVLNFCANNYLGLADNAEVIQAAKDALDSHGNGLASVRFICGTQDIHKNLEASVAKFHGTEDAILYAACFDANAGFFEAIFGPEDAVISDELNHASIIDGIRLCKAQRFRYKHRDLGELENCLREASNSRMRCIVTDGVFSMDGTIAPLKEICDLAEEYKAIVFVDDCHATGFFGATGRGSAEYCGVHGRVDVINTTIGKALGGAMGGYTAAPKPIVQLLRQRSRPYLFSNSLAPAVVGASQKVFDLITDDPSRASKLLGLTKQFRDGMAAAGFNVGGDPEHPICPVHLGDARLASEFADKMLERGVFVIGFSFPVVPKGKARIRVQISAAHTESEVAHTVDAFTAVGKELNVI